MTETPALAAEQRFIRETGVAGQIADLVDPVIANLGFRLVRVRIMGRDDQTVQIMAERADGTISIEDCEAISRQLSPLLDAADVMPGAYNLEISSPGIDRPLVRPSDFEDWAGHQAKIELTELLDGRRRFSGTLEGFEDGEARLEVDLDQIGVQVIGLPVDLIGEARLVLTDELVRDSLRRSKQAEKAAQGAGDPSSTGEVDGNDEGAADTPQKARNER
jgi:ribosome maturation factor RimP